MNKKKEIKFIDLFAGIGGFHLAIKKFVNEYNMGYKCVLVSETNQKAINVYRDNFKYEKEIKDIKKIDATEIQDFDILFAGFPCQAFSGAGKKMGFKDKTRGTLFFEVLKIIKVKKPKYLLLENVKHLVKHNNGETWKVIINELNKNGYITTKDPLILSPEEFGIPQTRPRVFIPCVRKETLKKDITNIVLDLNQYKKSKYDYSKIILNQKENKKYQIKPYIQKALKAWNVFLKKVKTINNRTLPVIWIDELNHNPIDLNQPKWKQKYLINMREIYNLNKKFIDKWKKKYKVDKWKKRERKFEWQAGKEVNDIKDSFIQLRQSGIRCKKKTTFPTLVAMVQTSIIFDKNQKTYRYLSPKEVSFLQSFPKDFIIDKSDNSAYKQFGNSINVKTAYLVIKELLKY